MKIHLAETGGTILNKSLPIVIILLVSCFVSPVLADITLGGGDGSVTLTNPDNSTFYYDSDNATTYDYVGNYPDGWWQFIGGPTDEELSYWVLGLVFGLTAVALAVVFMVIRKRKDEEDE